MACSLTSWKFVDAGVDLWNCHTQPNAGTYLGFLLVRSVTYVRYSHGILEETITG